jgi:hypothetical protein
MLNRRTFLMGAGAAVALPALPSLGQEAAFPRRMAFLFIPNGVNLKHWWPKEEGPLGELPSTLAPLESVKADILVTGGLTHDKARANGDGPGDHAREAGAFLTGCQPKKTDGKAIRAGVSVDQLAAQRIGGQTKLPSLEVGTERGGQAGNCDSGYSCAYSSNISWRTPTTPMGKLVSPREVFARLFGDPDAALSDQERARRAADQASVLDLVLEDARRLRNSLGAADQGKLDDYLESVRSVEKRIQSGAAERKQMPKLDLPEGVPADFPTHTRLMMDLVALAFQTDTTRIISFMMTNAGSDRTYPFADVREGHHHLSHHDRDVKKLELIRKIDVWNVQQLAYLLRKLKGMKEGDGSVLDNSMILYGSAIGDGNAHNHENLPMIMCGKGGGTITTGRFKKWRSETPVCNLFLSMLDRMNVRVEKFGDSTGRLEGL